MKKSQYLRKHGAFLQPYCFTVEQFTVDTGNGHIYTSKHPPQYTSDTKGSLCLFVFKYQDTLSLHCISTYI